MKNEKTCGTCKFYKPTEWDENYDLPKKSRRTVKTNTAGRCMRNPPQVFHASAYAQYPLIPQDTECCWEYSGKKT